MTTMDEKTIREAVRARYAKAARGAEEWSGGCCGGEGPSCGSGPEGDVISRDLYGGDELQGVPEGAALASLGCGNPTALAELRPGEVVLDLGSGGGIDVLLSARRVAPDGKAYGLDMTDEMLELARRNQREMGVENAEFLKGMIEDVPLPDESVDVVISNCVINLSTDKGRVLSEAYRVLAPGGRFAVADIVVQGQVPESLRRDLEAWSGCVAGALEMERYRELLLAVGFIDVEIEVVRAFGPEDLDDTAPDLSARVRGSDVEGRFCSAFVRARKPV